MEEGLCLSGIYVHERGFLCLPICLGWTAHLEFMLLPEHRWGRGGIKVGVVDYCQETEKFAHNHVMKRTFRTGLQMN